MKKTNRKMTVIALLLTMVLALAGCGGGSGSGDAGGGGSAAEANAGVRNITFVAPDGWNVNGAMEESFISFKNPETGSVLSVNAQTQEDLDEIKEYNEKVTAATLQEYFDGFGKETDEELKERHVEREKTTTLGTDAWIYKAVKDDGSLTEKTTEFLLDDAIYYISMYSEDSYDDEGNFNPDAKSFTDGELAAYDTLVASLQKGDGNALLKGYLTADSIGSIAFEVPAGYSVSYVSKDYIDFKKDGSDNISLSINMTREEDLKYYTDENGNVPESLEAQFASSTEYADENDKTTIAGFDGVVWKYPGENDKMYDCSAEFLADDAIYNIYLSSNAYDNEGNIKPDAEELTEEDIAAFDSFVASLKKK